MKVVFLGTPEFAIPTLEMLNKNYDVVLVVTQPDKPGKHNKLTEPPVKTKAKELGLDVFQPVNIKEDYQYILDKNADIMVTAAYGQFIPTKLLKSFKFALNVHGSLLPKHRGGAPIQRSIINGDLKTGVTIMEMIAKMDAGRMYSQEELPILDSDNSDSIFSKLSVLGSELLFRTLPDILSGKNQGIMQDESKATYSYNLTKQEEIINFNKKSREIFNQVRGLATNPGASFIYKNQTFKIYETKIVNDSTDKIPGTILSLKNEFKIKTSDGAISIILIKPQGKKTMPIKNFLNGQRIFAEDDVII